MPADKTKSEEKKDEEPQKAQEEHLEVRGRIVNVSHAQDVLNKLFEALSKEK